MTGDRYVVTTPRGFTEMFDEHTIAVLVRLGLIEHDYDGQVGYGIETPYHFYRQADR